MFQDKQRAYEYAWICRRISLSSRIKHESKRKVFCVVDRLYKQNNSIIASHILWYNEYFLPK